AERLRPGARRGGSDARGPRPGPALRGELADRPLRADRPDRDRRARARVGGAPRGAGRRADGAAGAPPRAAGRGPPRPEERARLLRLRLSRVCRARVVLCAYGYLRTVRAQLAPRRGVRALAGRRRRHGRARVPALRGGGGAARVGAGRQAARAPDDAQPQLARPQGRLEPQAARAQHRPDRLPEDAEVVPQELGAAQDPAELDVLEVERRRLALLPDVLAYLRGPGPAGCDPEAVVIAVRDLPLDHRHGPRPRAHEAHLPAEHAEELRQLVGVDSLDDRAGPGQVLAILLVQAGVGVRLARQLAQGCTAQNAELEDVELAAARDAALAEEPRAAVARDDDHVERDQRERDEQQGCDQQEQERGDDTVEHLLGQRVGDVGGRRPGGVPGQTRHPSAPRSRPVMRTVSLLLAT